MESSNFQTDPTEIRIFLIIRFRVHEVEWPCPAKVANPRPMPKMKSQKPPAGARMPAARIGFESVAGRLSKFFAVIFV